MNISSTWMFFSAIIFAIKVSLVNTPVVQELYCPFVQNCIRFYCSQRLCFCNCLEIITSGNPNEIQNLCLNYCFWIWHSTKPCLNMAFNQDLKPCLNMASNKDPRDNSISWVPLLNTFPFHFNCEAHFQLESYAFFLFMFFIFMFTIPLIPLGVRPGLHHQINHGWIPSGGERSAQNINPSLIDVVVTQWVRPLISQARVGSLRVGGDLPRLLPHGSLQVEGDLLGLLPP